MAGATVALACESAETKRCLAAYEAAQGRVAKVEAKSKPSVSESLDAVEAALTACRTANRQGEVDQLTRARNELSAQVGALDRRARRKSSKPSPEELARLQKEGDPSCPRGQAYRVKGALQEIRCTGPHLVEMKLEQVRAHFEEQDYRVRAPSSTTLEVERGAERYTFYYGAGPSAPPRCVVLVPAPGLPWAEALARATGANPSRLKNPGTVRVGQGVLPFRVDEQKVIVRVGDCPESG